MTSDCKIRRPVLVGHARVRWDEMRRQHQIVYPEGVLVLNDTGAAIVRLCDGRSKDDLIAELQKQYTAGEPADDVDEFLKRLAKKGLLRDDDDT